MKHVCGSVYKTIKKIKKTKERIKKNNKIEPKRSRLSIRTNRSLSINTNIPYKPPKSFKSIM
tara:strand:+ start:999 stop:1184 length:186 start_codon:yes stop_codon:yes gene_type:complete